MSWTTRFFCSPPGHVHVVTSVTMMRLMQLFLADAEHVDGFEAAKFECGGAPDLR